MQCIQEQDDIVKIDATLPLQEVQEHIKRRTLFFRALMEYNHPTQWQMIQTALRNKESRKPFICWSSNIIALLILL